MPYIREKSVVLTFDDGPQDTNDKLLDILKEKGVHATFFMVGELMEKHPQVVKRAFSEGHDIGWHSYDHSKQTSELTLEYVKDDIENGVKLIEKLTGKKPEFMRWPGGNTSTDIVLTAAENGMKTVNWSHYSFIDKNNGEKISPRERADAAFNVPHVGIRDGDIMLVHPRDNDDILEGIALMIDRFQSEGYKVLSLSEIFKERPDGVIVYYSPIF